MASIQEAVSTALTSAIASSMDPNAAATKEFLASQLLVLKGQAYQSKMDTMERIERKIEALKAEQADGRTIEVYQTMLEQYSGVRP